VEKLFIEPENEDEMRRAVLIQMARMAVRGDWNGFLSGSTATIGGSIADNQVAIGASVANTIEGSSALTFDTGTLQMSVGTDTPKINLSNNTKAVTLQVDNNQKLTVKGALNTFVLDVSSASSGITFPDGTTQTTAAGSGGVVQPSLPLETPSTYTFALMENLCNQGGTGFGDRSISIDSMTDSSGSFFYYSPFNASVTGTLATIAFRCTTAVASATVEVAIYDSDSDGNPQTLIGTATLDMSQQVIQETRATITPATTGSMDLTKGGQYWCGVKQGGVSNANTLGYYGYESATLGSNITGSGGSGSVFTGYNVLIGPATPPTTFSLLSVGQRQKMNLGGLYA
jgi:hypothetical protein